MIEIRLGDRYANSILVLAKERGLVDRVRDDFALIMKVCNSNPDFVNMLNSPLIDSVKKQSILDEIFKDSFSEITKTLVEIIVKKKRERYLDDIATRYLHQHDILNKVTRGELISATAMSAEAKSVVQKLVEKEMKTDFVLTEKIDPNLIGGFILRIGDKEFDASISARLRELKQEFDSNPYVKAI